MRQSRVVSGRGASHWLDGHYPRALQFLLEISGKGRVIHGRVRVKSRPGDANVIRNEHEERNQGEGLDETPRGELR